MLAINTLLKIVLFYHIFYQVTSSWQIEGSTYHIHWAVFVPRLESRHSQRGRTTCRNWMSNAQESWPATEYMWNGLLESFDKSIPFSAAQCRLNCCFAKRRRCDTTGHDCENLLCPCKYMSISCRFQLRIIIPVYTLTLTNVCELFHKKRYRR